MKVPCKECLVFVACRNRFLRMYGRGRGWGVISLIRSEKCMFLVNYLDECDTDRRVNEVRQLFGIDPVSNISPNVYSALKNIRKEVES